MASRLSRSEIERRKKEMQIRDLQYLKKDIRNVQEKVQDVKHDCKVVSRMFDNIHSEDYPTETNRILATAKRRLYFGEHFYPDLLYDELEYMAQELQKVIQLHIDMYDEYIRTSEETMGLV